jgi:hypothetical protein
MKGPTRRVVWGVATVLSIAGWFVLAQKEADTAKPEHDYAYFFVPPARYQVIQNSHIQLWYAASGDLTRVRVGYETADRYDRGFGVLRTDITEFRETTEPSRLAVRIGETYKLDIDPPSPKGHVRQEIRVFMDENGAVRPGDHIIWKKQLWRQIFPVPRSVWPWNASETVGLAFLLAAFSSFSATLFWQSRRG